MGSDGSVEQQIADAIASGELEPSRGVGKPIENLDNDPLWWARSLIRRERAAGDVVDVISYSDQQLAAAIDADDLPEARQLLAALNAKLETWNSGVDETFHIKMHDEVWLVTERANARL